MEIVIFGSGNVAWSLGHSFFQSGVKIFKIISRNTQTGRKLANELSSEFLEIEECDFKFPPNTICFLCYPDDVLRQIVPSYKIKDCIVVHAAGSVSIEVLKNISEKVGVFYPLQTFRSKMPVKVSYPILVDASDQKTMQILKNLAFFISNKVEEANDSKREKVHLAAVLVNNFMNHLFTLSTDYCDDNGIDFKLLIPLLKETVYRLEYSSTTELQTGPARRNDKNTISRHLQLIEDFPELKKIYLLFTESLNNYYYPKNN